MNVTRKTPGLPWPLRTVVVCLLVATTVLYGSGCHAYAQTAGAEPGLVGRVIVVDAGHGGPDGGAQGIGGVKEKTITLSIAKKLAGLLRQSGATVYLTRDTDTDLATDRDRLMRRRHQGDLRNRTRFVLNRHPHAFVSIHCNAVPSSAWYGAQMIYMAGNEEAKELADLMQAKFRAHLLPTKRSADDMDTLYLLKRIPGPTVLAEVGFITNPSEAQHLQTSRYQEQIAFAMYLALMEYFGGSDNSANGAKPS